MTLEFLSIFQDFSMTFPENLFFQDFQWFSMTVGTLNKGGLYKIGLCDHHNDIEDSCRLGHNPMDEK